MDNETARAILTRVRSERAAGGKRADDTFASAVSQMANRQLRSDALHDVRNLALLSAGVGATGRGLVGLYNLIANRRRKHNTRSGPAELPLPYPVEPEAGPKLASFMGLGGEHATTKGGIPWYGPAMMFGGLASLGAGWKGMDAVLDARRKSEREQELSQARREFHDALLSQYDRPLEGAPGARRKAAGDASEAARAGAAIDRLYDAFVKAATLADAGGMAAGGYGMYAGLSGLLAGALVYNKTRKRSQQAVIQKALQRRERRRFMEQPPEIYARPEPVIHPSPLPLAEEKEAHARPFLDRARRLTSRRQS